MTEWGGVAGKRVVLTGGTNGIGLAAAIELARRGADLTLVARNEARAADAVRRISAVSAGRVPDVMLADLASQSSIRRLADQLLARYPRIQVLVNNAGAIYARRLELSGSPGPVVPKYEGGTFCVCKFFVSD